MLKIKELNGLETSEEFSQYQHLKLLRAEKKTFNPTLEEFGIQRKMPDSEPPELCARG